MAVAHHEAAHVATAYEFGWWVRKPGVNIGAWPCAYLDHGGAYTTRARICISMAGMLAEEKFYGVPWTFTEDVVNHWREVCAGTPEVKHPSDPRRDTTDLRTIAWELYDDDMTDDAVRQAVAYWRNETWALLTQPRVWAGVTRVANALLRRGRLSPRAVKQILGESFFNREQDCTAAD
jgi:hypothetical protein